MKAFKGRPVIEGSDSPQLVDHALRASLKYWDGYKPDQSSAWRKTAADAWGAVQDGFSIVGDQIYRPEGSATLFLSPDDLELALIAYGCEQIDARAPNVEADIVAINGLLKGIEQLKAEAVHPTASLIA